MGSSDGALALLGHFASYVYNHVMYISYWVFIEKGIILFKVKSIA